MSTTHVAGPVVTIAGRLIQRCVVCGEKLADSKGIAVIASSKPINLDEVFELCPHWEESRLIHIEDRCQYVGEYFTAIETLPEDFCLALVE